MTEFRDWVVNDKNIEFPVPEDEFDMLAAEFYHQSGQLFGQSMGFIDGKLVYIKISFQLNGFRNMDRKETVDMYEKLEEIINDYNEGSSTGLQNGFQTAYDNWAWLHLREIFVTNAV